MNRSKINQFLLILLGLNMVSLYLWFRFIRARLPREIPFHLSFLGMIILFFICSIYIYCLFLILKRNKHKNYNPFQNIPFIFFENAICIQNQDYYNILKQNREKQISEEKKLSEEPIFTIFFKFFLSPLVQLDYVVKNYFGKIEEIIKKLIFFKKTSKLLILFELFPKIVISLVLLIETFYFHYLSLLYKVILLGIFILVEKYFIFSIKKIQEKLISLVEKTIYIEIEYHLAVELIHLFPELLPLYYDEDEKDYLYADLIHIPLKEFLKFQEKKYYENHNFIPFYASSTLEGIKNFREKNLLSSSDDVQIYINTYKKNIDLYLQILSFQIHYNNNKWQKVKTFLLFANLLCWLYILVISLPNLYLDSFFYSLLMSFIVEEPF